MLEEPTPAGPGEQAIVVDAMGGDNGPAVVVAGAAAAAAALQAPVILAGRAAELRGLAAEHPEVADLLQVAPAEDTIGMDEGALASWRRPRSSVAVACQLVRRGQAAAVVSAGSTGGVVATARLRLRSVPGLLRPALVVVLPTQPRPTFLLDAGAIADPKPEMLLQFAQLGVAYAQIAHNIPDPKVGLLTIGAEPGKGNKLARRAHELLTAPPPHGALPIRFTGNVEGTDLLAGTVDVIVTDGFTGNVALKLIEGVSQATLGAIRDVAMRSGRGRVGGMLLQSGLRSFREEIDPERQGGAYLLGLRQLGVLAHGSFTRHGIARAILRARRGAEEDLVGRTHRALEAAGALRRHDLLSVSDDTVLNGDP